jgi:hypothetical protein
VFNIIDLAEILGKVNSVIELVSLLTRLQIGHFSLDRRTISGASHTSLIYVLRLLSEPWRRKTWMEIILTQTQSLEQIVMSLTMLGLSQFSQHVPAERLVLFGELENPSVSYGNQANSKTNFWRSFGWATRTTPGPK